MNLLDKAVQTFINDNLNTPLAKLLLRKSPNSEWDMSAIALQIKAKNKAKVKLPTWFAKKDILYDALALEQCSSERTAAFKSRLISGKSIIDLSGGFGVDTYSFSQKFETVYHVEPNENLQNIVKHNFQKSGIENVKFINQSAEIFLKNKLDVDCVYLDPSRRSNSKRVFFLKDCEPDLINILPQIFQKTSRVLVKLSPMLDIKQTIQDLGFVKKVWVVASANEVKELLFLLKHDYQNEVEITAVNLKKNKEETLSFGYSDEEKIRLAYSKPQTYLYEPYVSILKSGAFKTFAHKYNLLKISPNTHLYTSEAFTDCPARVFEIKAVIGYQRKAVLKNLTAKRANITTRNFPETAQAIRQKLQLKDGGEDYIFATRDMDEKLVLIIGEKVK